MRDKPNRAQLAVALIGLGPTWDQHYRDALRRLSAKLSVRAVCDAVHVRAAAVAEEFRAATFSSPWQLAQRPEIKAWLILDPGWFDVYPAELAVRIGRPALFANCFRYDSQRLAALFANSMTHGESLVAEFPSRFAPATTRIRELLATKLGPVRRIDIDHFEPQWAEAGLLHALFVSRHYYVSLLDWCVCLFGRLVQNVEWTMTEGCAELNLHFAVVPGDELTPSRLAVIRLRSSVSGESSPHRRRIECERGVIASDTPLLVSWQTETEQVDESLAGEQSPFEIILDQFCRRAVGGLVPVPPLADALHGLEVFQAVVESLKRERPVSVKSSPAF